MKLVLLILVLFTVAYCTSFKLYGLEDIKFANKKTSRLSTLERKGYFEFIPQFKASLNVTGASSTWQSNCFSNYKAEFKWTSTSSAVVHFEAKDRTSTFCTDLYLFAMPNKFHLKEVIFSGRNRVELRDLSQDDITYLKDYGFQVFLIPDGIFGTLLDIWDTLNLFMGPWEQQNIVTFFKQFLNVTLEHRAAKPFIIDESQIKSGDYLAIFKMDGLHGGENSMEAYGYGGRTGHVAACLWIDGTLYVVESMGGGTDGHDGIIRTPYRQWMQAAIQQKWLVSIARLSPSNLAKWNNDKAVAWFKSFEGLPYGYHNYIFGWIDTAFDNYPPPVSAEAIVIVGILLDRISPALATRMFNEALNKRLGTSGLNTYQILTECEKRNISFYDLITVPEQDDWVYSDGHSRVCSAFVMNLYKAAGVFDNLDFQATELTPKDSYIVNVYDGTTSWRPSQCNTDNLAYCQVSGEFNLYLPGFNTIKPYDHMFEKCGGMPPNYFRQPGC